MARPIGGATNRPVSDSAPCRVPSALRRFAGDVRGATSIEYALIAGLIFMICVGSIRLYSSRMNSVYGKISSAMSQVN